jgi:hypothetical protein
MHCGFVFAQPPQPFTQQYTLSMSVSAWTNDNKTKRAKNNALATFFIETPFPKSSGDVFRASTWAFTILWMPFSINAAAVISIAPLPVLLSKARQSRDSF